MSQQFGCGTRLPHQLYNTGLGLRQPTVTPTGRPSGIQHYKTIDLKQEEESERIASKAYGPVKSRISVESEQRKTDKALETEAYDADRQGGPLLYADARLASNRRVTLNSVVTTISQNKGSVAPLENSALPFPVRFGALPTNCKPKRNQSGFKEDSLSGRSQPQLLAKTIKSDVKFLDGGLVDCFMWTGEHDEDRLSELAIKTGYSVKTHVANESNTARPSLWPHFKNKSGLQALSSLLVSVVQQRQDCGLLTANSTFKPPPRVTSTDAKKEGWLRDLANVTIPLRRLSRTIPHGIRGSALLEQCLTKNIPMKRAVWLAKCVGANEIRAFKRKGISGAVTLGHELKWIEDWTALVESCLKNTIDCCRHSASREKAIYAIQLSSSFYVENLLDHNHWMNWLLRYFEQCTSEEIPASLLLIQIYWESLISTMRNGRRLALTCFAHLKRLSLNTDQDLLNPVAQRLKDVVRSLVISRPNCIVMPSMWQEYRPFFKSMQEIADQTAEIAFRHVLDRNDRITRYSMTVESPHRSVFTILDCTGGDVEIEQLLFQCMSILPDAQELIFVLLRWASTVYREGPYKTYTVVRMIRHLAAKGIDIESAILVCLALLRVDYGLQPQKIGHLLAELVRSRDFDVGQYLRWLLATGALNVFSGDNSGLSCDVRLLVDIPTYDLPGSVVSLRRTLLRYVGMNVPDEAQVIDTIKQDIVLQLPRLFSFANDERSNHDSRPPVVLSEISSSIAFEISRWLQESLAICPLSIPLRQSDVLVNNNVAHIMTTLELQLVCSIVEELGDYHTLANILRTHSEGSEVDVLLFVIDKLEEHQETLLVIDAMGSILHAVFEQYLIRKHNGTQSKELTLALMHMFEQWPLGSHILPYLKRELISLNQSLGVAACTPASDNTPENTQNATSDIEDEIEGIASSGASIDYQTFIRLFKKIALHLEESREEAEVHCRILAAPSALFGRLQGFDEDAFHRVMLGWLSEVFQGLNASDPATVVPTLISSGYLSFPSLVDCAETAFEEQDIQTVATAATRLLTLLVPRPAPRLRGSKAEVELASDCPLGYTATHKVHQFYIQQRGFCTQHRRILLRVLRRAMQDSTLTFDRALISILREGVVNNVQEVIHELVFALPAETPIILANWRHLMEQLVDPNDEFGFSSMPLEEIISTIFKVANDLSLPFCQFGLSCIVVTLRQSENSTISFTKTIIDVSKAAIARDCLFWPDLISVLDKTIGRGIREYAEVLLLSDELRPMNPCTVAEESHEAKLQRYLKVVDATASSIPDMGDPRVARNIIDQINLIIQQVQHLDSASALSDKGLLATLQLRTNILLQLSSIHTLSFPHTISIPSARTIHLTNLSNLLVYSSSYFSLSTLDHIYDIAATFTIDLTTSEFSHLSKTFDPLIKHDSRIRFLFGFRDEPGSWLHVSPHHQQQPQVSTKTEPFALRHWELLQDSTPNVGANDTALSLRLFGARKV